MALDYEKIRQDHERSYGTRVPEYGKRFFEDMYADRTHFIFELLQNAEDAVRRRGCDWDGPRAVSFRLSAGQLRVGHFGDPFNERDVRSICSIDDSTKKESLTEIGRFGIGFKSVYSFTNRPEVHSGPENFAINHYVWPTGIEPLRDKSPDETVFVLPFRADVPSANAEINDALRNIGIQTLLFLRQIDEITWESEDGGSGHYVRETESVDEGVLRTTVVSQVDGEDNIGEQRWLVFHSRIAEGDTFPAARVEIAFLTNPENQRFQRLDDPTLFAYFPTERETHCGFLVNGPYRTTLNRENVPDHDEWNRRLVAGTASLLIDGLRWLRNKDRLDASVLRCLPLRSMTARSAYTSGNLLDPLYEETKRALSLEPLLPRLGDGYIAAQRARIGRTDALRSLFSRDQLSAIYGSEEELAWLNPGISQESDLFEYVTNDLKVEEIRPESVVRRLSQAFLEAQSDDWIQSLYEFLGNQPVLARETKTIPVVRLRDGTHVPAMLDGRSKAYLPTSHKTDFPTVAQSVCRTADALRFLRLVGLNEPDAVDDVLWNLIPKYAAGSADVDSDEYASDIRRMLRAFESSTGAQKRKLIDALSETAFVRRVDTASPPTRAWGQPCTAYLATEELTNLFDGVPEIWFVDRTYDCLSGENVDQLLEACGCARRLRAVQFKNPSRFSDNERKEMRLATRGKDRCTGQESVLDRRISGLEPLLNSLPQLAPDSRSQKAESLWRAVAKVCESAFSGEYKWFYYNDQYCAFDAEFVKLLNETAWVPTPDGEFMKPSSVIFDDLRWEESTFLQSKVLFKPSTTRRLAAEAGFEPELLDLLKRRGITTKAEWLETIGDDSERDQTSETPLAATQADSTNESPFDGDTTAVHATCPENGDSIRGEPEQDTANQDSLEVPFAAQLYEMQTVTPPAAPDNPAVLPAGGPGTEHSARTYTRRSVLRSRTEPDVLRTVTTSELGPDGRALSDEFRDMVEGDYGKRCQICSKTFVRSGGGWQVNVVHVVPLRADRRANHFGDLLGLCGWHFNLLQYGEWSLLDSETNRPFEEFDGWLRGWERMRLFIMSRTPDTDDLGNPFVGVPVRFSNVYQNWESGPTTVEEKIRYSIPHWSFLCELIRATGNAQ